MTRDPIPKVTQVPLGLVVVPPHWRPMSHRVPSASQGDVNLGRAKHFVSAAPSLWVACSCLHTGAPTPEACAHAEAQPHVCIPAHEHAHDTHHSCRSRQSCVFRRTAHAKPSLRLHPETVLSNAMDVPRGCPVHRGWVVGRRALARFFGDQGPKD